MRCKHCNKKIDYAPSPVFDYNYRHRKSWSAHCFDLSATVATPKKKKRK